MDGGGMVVLSAARRPAATLETTAREATQNLNLA